jgi:hypothetical protein
MVGSSPRFRYWNCAKRVELFPVSDVGADRALIERLLLSKESTYFTSHGFAGIRDKRAVVAKARVLAGIGDSVGGYLATIWHAEFQRAVGIVGAMMSDDRMEIGCILLGDCFGQRLGTEALSSLVSLLHARRPWLTRAQAVVDVDNGRALRSAEKLGLVREELLTGWITHPQMDRLPRDCWLMGCQLD